MVATSRAGYNGLYTLATEPIKTLALYYTMIQLLIKNVISHGGFACFLYREGYSNRGEGFTKVLLL